MLRATQLACTQVSCNLLFSCMSDLHITLQRPRVGRRQSAPGWRIVKAVSALILEPQGLPLGLEAHVMTPNGVVFLFISFLSLILASRVQEGNTDCEAALTL